MRTPMGELSGPDIAGGLTALAGVAVWRLGIEFERAWLRSCDGGPLSGETSVWDRAGAPLHAGTGLAAPAIGKRHRWVAQHQHQIARRSARVA
jgi:hypothetical protein